MKSVTFLLIFLPCCCFAQSFPELIALYEKECSQITNDTVDQSGTVSYEVVPVIDPNGKILHYALGKADTVWQEPECPTFKYPKPSDYLSISSDGYWGASRLSLTGSNYPIYSSEKLDKTRVEITRKYVCQVKMREVEPFSEHFWQWLKKRGG